MKKVHRLRERKDFAHLFRTGRRVHTPFFSFVVARAGEKNTRAACVVAKSVEKSAVLRNRIRRRVNEWFRVRAPIPRDPVDIAIIVTKQTLTLSRTRFYEELEKGITQCVG